MKPENHEFIPEPDIGTDRMKQLQRQISRKAVFEDKFDFDLNADDLTVAGVDQAFTKSRSVSVAIAMKNGKIIEEESAAEEVPMPYIPGLLAFREGSSIVSTLKKLDVEPDMLLLDGSGRIHFRQAGIATHIGVIFDVPAIGVAKNLLCGKVDLPGKMQQGNKRKVHADSSVENLDETVIGYAYQSRQYSSPKQSINPLYISPGHRVNVETSVNIVSRFCKDYKLPEPIQIADSKVSQVKKEYSTNSV